MRLRCAALFSTTKREIAISLPFRFVATRSRADVALPSPASAVEKPIHNLPTLPTRTIGPAKIVTSLISCLLRWRFSTFVATGDIGKTTVALARAVTPRAERCRRCNESLRC